MTKFYFFTYHLIVLLYFSLLVLLHFMTFKTIAQKNSLKNCEMLKLLNIKIRQEIIYKIIKIKNKEKLMKILQERICLQ